VEKLESRGAEGPAPGVDLDHDLDCLQSAVEDTKPAGHSVVCASQNFSRGACNCQYEASLALYERDKAALARVRAALEARSAPEASEGFPSQSLPPSPTLEAAREAIKDAILDYDDGSISLTDAATRILSLLSPGREGQVTGMGPSPSGRDASRRMEPEAALEEMDALERLRDIRYHLVNIPPALRNQATAEAIQKIENHIGDIVRRPVTPASSNGGAA
jgi:hypothetical protein